MENHLNVVLKVNVGVVFVGDDVLLIGVEGDFCFNDIKGVVHQLIAEHKGWA